MAMKRIMCYLQGMPEYDLLLHPSEACYGLWAFGTGHLPALEHRRSSPVPDVYSTRHRLCRVTNLSAHA
jgi:hypothetical protein